MSKRSKTSRGKKFSAQYVHDDTKRKKVFARKKRMIFKKAHELSTLTRCEILVLIVNQKNNDVFAYASNQIQPYLSKNKGLILKSVGTLMYPDKKKRTASDDKQPHGVGKRPKNSIAPAVGIRKSVIPAYMSNFCPTHPLQPDLKRPFPLTQFPHIFTNPFSPYGIYSSPKSGSDGGQIYPNYSYVPRFYYPGFNNSANLTKGGFTAQPLEKNAKLNDIPIIRKVHQRMSQLDTIPPIEVVPTVLNEKTEKRGNDHKKDDEIEIPKRPPRMTRRSHKLPFKKRGGRFGAK